MIVNYLTIILFANFAFGKYDDETWLDYDSLRNYDNNSNTDIESFEKNYRNNLYIKNYNNNFFVNKSISDIEKIVGGSSANIKNFQYQVSLQEKGFGHFCGGSLITYKWILSAAHCFYGSNTPLADYFVRAGSAYHAKGGVIGYPQKIYVAKKFKSATNDWDISMLKLKNGFTKQFNYPIRRIFIRKKLPPPGTTLIVSGWGSLSSTQGIYPPKLRKATVKLIDYNICNTKTNNAGQLTKRMFCAGYIKGGKDSCQGDSGGPIVAYRKLVGIVSWGFGCALKNSPGVYTRVPTFLKFIKDLLKNG